ncbi:hypothetical protein [Noviherbaspirillum galbum]|uniref:Uncharacterized protein n=1 Tax=Noviherbaspirillum galbum TaxID=2709383 RepID=A0A6B3SVJ5_9BURK|nr:hypothetical protein [Noviherbaspirillum galbum]NEX62916.1 hypothetical protein [Noviherbaspirillum galbum]
MNRIMVVMLGGMLALAAGSQAQEWHPELHAPQGAAQEQAGGQVQGQVQGQAQESSRERARQNPPNPQDICAAGKDKCAEGLSAKRHPHVLSPPLSVRDVTPPKEAPRREAAPVTVPNVTVPAPPPTITGCDGGGCWNSEGGRYNGPGAAPGGAVTSGSGRLCTTNGAFVQCF